MAKRKPLSRRVAALDGYRVLTNPEAESLLSTASDNKINEPIEWTTHPDPSPTEARMQVTVFNTRGERVLLTGRIPYVTPHRSHWTFTWGAKQRQEHPSPIRRLDLRDNHGNPDGERWERATHKHRWTEQDGNAWAYTPDDIPHKPVPDGPEDYREIFEAFAAECHVGFGPDYLWSDPPEQPPHQPTTWEVP